MWVSFLWKWPLVERTRQEINPRFACLRDRPLFASNRLLWDLLRSTKKIRIMASAMTLSQHPTFKNFLILVSYFSFSLKFNCEQNAKADFVVNYSYWKLQKVKKLFLFFSYWTLEIYWLNFIISTLSFFFCFHSR